MFKKIFLMFGLIVFTSCCVSEDKRKDQLDVSVISFQDSILVLDIGFNFEKPVTVYDWRGQIYPALGYYLYIYATDALGNELSISNYEKPMPIVGHPLDVKTTTEYHYQKYLKVYVLSDNRPIKNCADFIFIYDTLKANGTILSPIKLEYKLDNICPE
ncbi:MAG: hypothetical protein JXA04_03170 [Gammaproteobacteria bacterium]|nr:hypothetical protein [Gammaproteobacteria bacterium]